MIIAYSNDFQQWTVSEHFATKAEAEAFAKRQTRPSQNHLAEKVAEAWAAYRKSAGAILEYQALLDAQEAWELKR